MLNAPTPPAVAARPNGRNESVAGVCAPVGTKLVISNRPSASVFTGKLPPPDLSLKPALHIGIADRDSAFVDETADEPRFRRTGIDVEGHTLAIHARTGPLACKKLPC
jgi:hypothetical protein